MQMINADLACHSYRGSEVSCEFPKLLWGGTAAQKLMFIKKGLVELKENVCCSVMQFP